MNQLAQTNRAGVETISLPLIDEPSGHEVIVIGGLQTFGRVVVSSNDTTSKPNIIHPDQATATIYTRGHSN